MRLQRVYPLLLGLLIALLVIAIAPLRAQNTPAVDCADTATTGIPQTECEALVALYNANDGDNWENNDDWRQTPRARGLG